jgi:hypothetical protein
VIERELRHPGVRQPIDVPLVLDVGAAAHGPADGSAEVSADPGVDQTDDASLAGALGGEPLVESSSWSDLIISVERPRT